MATVNSFKYQVVWRVNNKAGAVIAHDVAVLRDGDVPPEMKVGDAWRFDNSGAFIETTVTVSTRKFLVDTSGNWLMQYDFTLQENP